MNKRRFKGYDYEAHDHPDLIRRAPATELPVEIPEWLHKGGGYYENTATGVVRRGKPD